MTIKDTSSDETTIGGKDAYSSCDNSSDTSAEIGGQQPPGTCDDININQHVITLFSDQYARTKTEINVTLPDLAALIRNSSAKAKAKLPWLKLAQFGNAPSPKNSLRYDGNILAVTGVELDYDGEQIPFDEAIAVLRHARLRALAYTSPSHTEEKPRWRVVFPTSNALSPPTRKKLAKRADALFGVIFSSESFALSQAYYYGHVHGNDTPLKVEILDGDFIDSRDDLSDGEQPSVVDEDVKGTQDSHGVDEGTEEAKIATAEEYYWPTIRLLGKWSYSGMTEQVAVERLHAVFDQVPAAMRMTTPWKERRDEVAKHAARIWQKDAKKHSDRPQTGTVQYYEANGSLYRRGGKQIANFAPRILEEVDVDDGENLVRHWRIGGTLKGGRALPPVDMLVEDLAGNWWLKAWGAAPVVAVHQAAHLIPAMQSISRPTQRTKYAHLGWRSITGKLVYLHAGGAIGAAGPVSHVEVAVTGRLAECVLPRVSDLKRSLRATLGLLDSGELGLLAAAAAYRAPLGAFCKTSLSIFTSGPTGVFKSAIAGIAQAHWGAGFRGDHLLDNWTSTANSLEKMAFAAKDMLCTIDDFKPAGSSVDVQRAHQTADRIIRGAADGAGRGRMNAGGDLRQVYRPRGLIWATGEDLPRGESLRARCHVHHVQAGDVDTARLTALQEQAAEGLLAQSMAGYVQWLANQGNALQEKLAARTQALRPAARQVCAGGHTRAPENLISLALGVEMLLAFAFDAEAIDEAEVKRRWESAWQLLANADQRADLAAENAVEQFLELICEALSAGRVHVADRDGNAPVGREDACGWRRRAHAMRDAEDGSGDYPTWEARGDRIGWLDGEILSLSPAASFAAAETLARAEGRSLALNPATLGRRLKEAGVLISQGDTGNTKKIRTANGRVRVYMMRLETVLGTDAPTDDLGLCS